MALRLTFYWTDLVTFGTWAMEAARFRFALTEGIPGLWQETKMSTKIRRLLNLTDSLTQLYRLRQGLVGAVGKSIWEPAIPFQAHYPASYDLQSLPWLALRGGILVYDICLFASYVWYQGRSGRQRERCCAIWESEKRSCCVSVSCTYCNFANSIVTHIDAQNHLNWHLRLARRYMQSWFGQEFESRRHDYSDLSITRHLRWQKEHNKL